MFRLDHKVALITGAGSGIGEAIAQLFASQGARVVVVDVQAEAAERVAASIVQGGHLARALACDVTDEDAVAAAFAEVVRQEGHLDVVVNNAGISHVGSILETSVADWERVMAVNARGVFLGCREAVRVMLAQTPPGGVIINMASTAAVIGVECRLPYSASKGAVAALTRSVAIDFAAHGIRCNAIAPGTVQTPFVDGYLARNFAGHEAEARATLDARQPVGRMGQPAEIAAAALYLAVDEAAFVTGSMLTIDGGWTAK
ncbi:MAG: glucose 1-dehydrogenase [Ktedonobacterales bacterium]|nr:glucose 1-dehydrogenase [Ktedonobacterales bacterium]